MNLREIEKPATPSPTVLERLGRRLDRAVLALAPERGRRRIAARAKGEKLAAYEAASTGRFHGKWTGSRGSADQDLLFGDGALDTIRRRSRELVRNDPHASSIVRVLEDNVVGTGIKCQSRARPGEETGLSVEAAREWNDATERVFAEASQQLDATGHHDFYGLQRLVLRCLKVDGEAFVHPIMVVGEPDRTLATAVELVEAERVASPHGSSDTVREGVEVGARGQAIAYHVRKGHPGDQFSQGRAEEYQRVRRFRQGRANFIHLFKRERPGQTRGAPILSPALSMFDHLRSYLRYELVAARVNSSIALFVKRSGGGDEPTIEWDSAEEHYVEGIEPGGIEYLGEGEEIQTFNPNRPGTTFDPFVVRNLRAIGAAVGLPYELFARDASKVNYTSSRTLLLEAFRGFRGDQALLVSNFCEPVRRLVLVEAYAKGLLPTVEGFADSRRRAALLRAAWIPPARGWVDPVKEIQASTNAIVAGLSTRSDETAGNGRDFEETARLNAEELRRLLDLEAEYELPPGSLAGGAIPAPTQELAPSADELEPELEDQVEADQAEPDQVEAEAYAANTADPAEVKAAADAWENEGGVRRPITITPPGLGVVAADDPAEGPDDDLEENPTL